MIKATSDMLRESGAGMCGAYMVTKEDTDGGAVEIIRVISARRATPRERRRYENEKG
jgi:uncharacterized DUF497 family protein